MTPKVLIKSFAYKAESIDPEKRTLRTLVNTNDVDRDGEIVEPMGFKEDIGNFKKNPVLLWGHNPFEPAIGKATEIDISKEAMEMEFQFMPLGEMVRSDEVFAAFKAGVLTSFSVGFRALEVKPPEFDDAGQQTAPRRITRSELLEVSAVTIPANTNAVVKRLGSPEEVVGRLDSMTDAELLNYAARLVAETRTLRNAGVRIPAELNKALTALQIASMGVKTPDEPPGDCEVATALADVDAVLSSLSEAVSNG